jgi:hypothetical protein
MGFLVILALDLLLLVAVLINQAYNKPNGIWVSLLVISIGLTCVIETLYE